MTATLSSVDASSVTISRRSGVACAANESMARRQERRVVVGGCTSVAPTSARGPTLESPRRTPATCRSAILQRGAVAPGRLLMPGCRSKARTIGPRWCSRCATRASAECIRCEDRVERAQAPCATASACHRCCESWLHVGHAAPPRSTTPRRSATRPGCGSERAPDPRPWPARRRSSSRTHHSWSSKPRRQALVVAAESHEVRAAEEGGVVDAVLGNHPGQGRVGKVHRAGPGTEVLRLRADDRQLRDRREAPGRSQQGSEDRGGRRRRAEEGTRRPPRTSRGCEPQTRPGSPVGGPARGVASTVLEEPCTSRSRRGSVVHDDELDEPGTSGPAPT